MRLVAKNKFIWILLVLIASFIFIKIYFHQKGNDWQEYTNSRYHFTIKYPYNWELGEPEFNNAGREFFSPDKKIQCYAYGFQNALITSDGRPQTLEEFIDWLISNENLQVLEKKQTILSGKPAIELTLQKEENQIQQAVYTLDEETGHGFYCLFPDLKSKDSFQLNFKKMADSFQITIPQNNNQLELCTNLIDNLITPLKDKQTFIDDQYPEVTLTSRESWDKQKLPKQVLSLENNGYKCYPIPYEYYQDQQPPGMNIQPAVKSVEWSCELEYQDYQYFKKDDFSPLKKLEAQGYTCQKQKCLDDNQKETFVWLCYLN